MTVRKVDEMGRVVLPIDARRKLGIAEGTPLEITSDDSMIMIRRAGVHNPLDSFSNADLVRELQNRGIKLEE